MSATSSAQVRGVLPERRLVEHQHPRPRREHRRDGEPPLLAARERVRVRLGERGRAAAARAARRRAPRSRGGARPSARGPTSSSARTVVVEQLVLGVLEHRADAGQQLPRGPRDRVAASRPPTARADAAHPARRGREQAREREAERRLARAVGPDDAQHLAGSHLQVERSRRPACRARARRRATRARSSVSPGGSPRRGRERRAGCREPTRRRRRAPAPVARARRRACRRR